MIYVRIELWPGGNRRGARLLQEVKIANDETGTDQHGNYDVFVSHSTTYRGDGFTDPLNPEPSEIWRTGRVVGFARKLAPVELVKRALDAALSFGRGRDHGITMPSTGKVDLGGNRAR